MTAPFDPYHRWLGIPPSEQPPHHYRLLGLAVYEQDVEVIAQAADRQMTFVQLKKLGPNSDASQRLLNELAVARVVLLNPKKKAAYDAQLQADLAARAALPTDAAPPSDAALPFAAESPSRDSASPPSEPAFVPPAFRKLDYPETFEPAPAPPASAAPLGLWIGLGAGALALLFGLGWALTSGESKKPDRKATVAQSSTRSGAKKDAQPSGGIVMPELVVREPEEPPQAKSPFDWFPPRPPEESVTTAIPATSTKYRPPVRAADIEEGYSHVGDIDCNKGRRQIDVTGVDFAKSWTLRFDAQIDSLEPTRQQMLLFWGDERPQQDPFFVSVFHRELVVSVTDVPSQKREKLQVPVPRQVVQAWATYQVDYTAADRSLRFYIDRKLVAEATLAGPPAADKPMPYFLGDAEDRKQAFKGRLRNIRFGNVAASSAGG